ncbi:MAG: TolC family protein, partial [Bacteroidota bacterium]
KILSTIILIFSVLSVIAQNDTLTKTHYLSLNDVREYAIVNNYQNQNAEIDIDIAKKKIWETTAIGLPQVNGEVNYQNMLKIPTTLLPGEMMGAPGTYVPVQFGQQNSLNWGVTATQLVFSGEYLVGLKASKIFLELSKRSYTKSSTVIKETVTKSYYLVLIAEESKKILEETNANFENLLREIEESHRLGFVEDIDVDQLRLTKQNNDNTIISVNNQIELAYRLLKYQLGIDFKDELKLSDSLDYFVENLDFNSILSEEFDLNSNIDYKLMQTQEGLSILNLKREKSLFLPQLSAFYTYSENAYNNEFSNLFSTWYPTSIIGLKLTVPIFSSGMRRSKVQQKQLELKKVQNSKLELEQGLHLQVEQLRSNFTNAKLKFDNENWNMELSQRINNKTEIKYKKGMSSANDLMLSQNQYLMALNNYYQAMSNLLAVRAQLEFILEKN